MSLHFNRLEGRVAQIEARLSLLDDPPPPPKVEAPTLQRTETLDASGRAIPSQPFNIQLGSQMAGVSVRSTMPKLSPEIESLVEKYSAKNGLDPNLVRAVIKAESDGDPTCTSHKGAVGLMQIMPEELSLYGIRDAKDPEQNILAGTKQLADKLKRFGGNLEHALAAYNAGSGAVKKYGGVPPYPETQNYVKRIYGLMGMTPSR